MNRLSELLEDAAAGPVGFDHHDIGARVRRRQRRRRVAVVSMAVLFAGAAFVGTSLGNGTEQRIDATATSPQQTQETLAEYLLTDTVVEEQLPDLARSETAPGNRDYAVLGDTEFSGPTAKAVAGVARLWSQPYSWSAGDPVSNQVINVSSTAIRFPRTDDAESAAAEVLGLYDVAQTPGAIQITSDRFDGFCEPAGTDPDPRACVATTTVGNTVVAVQLDFAGTDNRLDVFQRLVDAAALQLPTPTVGTGTEPAGTQPSWLVQRSGLPDCGTDDESASDYPNMDVRRCFKDAFDSDQPAEMTRLQFGDEGESIRAHFRVLGDGRYEIVGEQFPSPADPAFGGDSWIRYECDRFEFIDDPGGEVDLVPWINYDGECRLVEEVIK